MIRENKQQYLWLQENAFPINGFFNGLEIISIVGVDAELHDPILHMNIVVTTLLANVDRHYHARKFIESEMADPSKYGHSFGPQSTDAFGGVVEYYSRLEASTSLVGFQRVHDSIHSRAFESMRKIRVDLEQYKTNSSL